jgi:hypothetical protein
MKSNCAAIPQAVVPEKMRKAKVLSLDVITSEVNKTNALSKGAENEIESLASLALVDLSKKAVEPQNILEVQCSGKYSVFATLGNFSLVIGKAKSRKTFFISLLIAAFLGGKLLMNKLQAWLEADKNVIVWFDTEQSEYHVQRSYKTALRTAGVDQSNNLKVYALRKFDTVTRLKIIEHLIYSTSGLAVVVIDGIRDIVTDINSPEEATFIANKLLKWTEELNIHIITVLHQNKADNNARGHVGTELINKAESVLSIAKDQNNTELSVVTPEYFRDKEFLQFAFSINENGLPAITDEWVNETAKDGKKKALSPNNFPDESYRAILKEVFKNIKRPKYNELLTQLILQLGTYGITMGRSKAIEFLTHIKNKGWVKENDGRLEGEKYQTYRINIQ